MARVLARIKPGKLSSVLLWPKVAAVLCEAWRWMEAVYGITPLRPGTGADLERGRPRPLRRAGVAAVTLAE
jgi:hypothetical protein